ncbi:MAG: hypothetical protein PHF86_04010 [Candidatus Nanoarchaeia archaeon]|jgi:hypothetical protein|nr:hypothetical protein [Candidatus Nanoarchaeia archaeon]
MQLVQYFSDGSLVFNWDQLPEHIRSQTELRDKLFVELQNKFKVNSRVTSRDILDLNIYAIKRIKECTRQKT